MTLSLATVRVLAGRDVVRFFRQPTRVIGALVQPILFWWVIGSGFAGSFQAPGVSQLGYLEFFYPGVLTMVLLFSAIFGTITVIEDRREGFLQSVLAGPGPRWSVAVGKSLGCTAVAMIQASLFLLLAPFAHVPFGQVLWLKLGLTMALTALGLTGLGVTLAWWVSSSAGYHAVMSVVLIPMWILSGAMFPLRGAVGVVQKVMAFNPMRFSVDALREALYGSAAAVEPAGRIGNLAAVAVFAVILMGVATASISRRD